MHQGEGEGVWQVPLLQPPPLPLLLLLLCPVRNQLAYRLPWVLTWRAAACWAQGHNPQQPAGQEQQRQLRRSCELAGRCLAVSRHLLPGA